MKLEAQICPRCGGELDGVYQDNALRCSYCGALLRIEHSPESVKVRIVDRQEDGKTEREKSSWSQRSLKSKQRKSKRACPSICLLVAS